MNFDHLLYELQSWTNNIPLIILGSGASVQYGLPSMGQLGEHLKESLHFNNDEHVLEFSKFKESLDKFHDLEKTLSEIQLNNIILSSIIKKTWDFISEADLNAFNEINANQKSPPLTKLVQHLLRTTSNKLSIITTNYDRIAEYCVGIAEAFVCTGFAQNYIGHFSDRIFTNNLGKVQGFKGQVNILKVHGSLDWFKAPNGSNIHIPLHSKIPDDYRPMIVTPGLSKYSETHNEPYRTIFTLADNEIQNANGYLSIGYGFNDSHVQSKLVEKIKSKPIILLTKELTQKTKEIILEGECKKYILMEEYNTHHTRIYSSSQGENIIQDCSYWNFSDYINLIF